MQMKMSANTLRQWIMDGRGQGHGSAYRPWLQMSRRRAPSNANVNFRYLSTLGRHGHFLSSNEWHIALWLMWLGLDDLREQFPLWPFRHPHPLYGRPELATTVLPWSRGTIAMAKDLGIKHGVFIGTRIPYIATTDFMISIKDQTNSLTAIAIAAKPEDIVNGKKSIARVNERLILEMACMSEIGIRWFLLSNGDIPCAFRENLELCQHAAKLPEQLANNNLVIDFCSTMTEWLKSGASIGDALANSSAALKLIDAAPHALLYHGLWHRLIPIDLREPIVLSHAANLTDFSWAIEMKEQILGGRHD
jgi:hypothetical protein